ncbi:MAG: multi-sensor hybrid histidine [Desulfobulbaceae bacterium]|nr:MAG: multi-sensor hybrid histidine [Desulfobulbaceae bacterium]
MSFFPKKYPVPSKEELLAMADSSRDWEVFCGGNCNWKYVSPACERITGYTPEEFLESPDLFENILHPDDKERVKTQCQTHSNHEFIPFEVEFRLFTKTGDTRLIWRKCQAARDTQGNLLGRRVSIQDITDQHATGAAQQQVRTMFMNGPVIVFLWQNRRNWPVESISGNAFDLLGYSSEEFLSGSVLYSSIIHPDDIVRVTAEVEANSLPESTNFIHKPYRLIARGGRIIWVLESTTLVRDSTGQITHYHGYLVDISHTVQMEEEALAVKNRLEFIIDSTSLGTWDWNIQTGELVYNNQCLEMLGYGPGELSPNVASWLKLIDPEQKVNVIRALTDHLEGRSPRFSLEHRLQHKSGRWIWVLNSGKVWEVDHNGVPARACGIHLDITHRKEQELLLLETIQRKEQEKRIESLKTMAVAVAHRFNNSMLVVLGNLEMLCRNFPDESKSKEMALMALQEGKEASKIGQSMLTYLGYGIPRKQPQDLAALACESFSAIIKTFPSAIISQCITPPAPIHCRFDTIQIRQVLNNVLTNALESLTPKTRQITLTFGTAVHSPADFPLLFREGLPDTCRYGFCRIADNGVGIATKDIERIFEPFFTTRFIGRGLGLALAAGIMRSHQGAIVVKSTLKRGTKITILLPMEE